MRPFVCARDVALELLRRGLWARRSSASRCSTTRRWCSSSPDRARGYSRWPNAPCSAALPPSSARPPRSFVSDEKTEVFLRDQRRSKAHRTLVPDPGAPCDEVMSIDLAAVDPLLSDETGQVRPVRDLAGKTGEPGDPRRRHGRHPARHARGCDAAQVETRAAAPRLHRRPASRQVLEVLGQAGALVDLIATGARIIEADRRVVTGRDVHRGARPAVAAHERSRSQRAPRETRFVVASAETLAYAVATGNVGDPRSFKRPVRVTVPRALPTDDVLILRERRPDAARPRSGRHFADVDAPVVERRRKPRARRRRPVCRRRGRRPNARSFCRRSTKSVRSRPMRPAKARSKPSSPPSFRVGSSPSSPGRASSRSAPKPAVLKSLKGPEDDQRLPGDGGDRRRGRRHDAKQGQGQPSWLAVGIERSWTFSGTSRPDPSRQPRCGQHETLARLTSSSSCIALASRLAAAQGAPPWRFRAATGRTSPDRAQPIRQAGATAAGYPPPGPVHTPASADSRAVPAQQQGTAAATAGRAQSARLSGAVRSGRKAAPAATARGWRSAARQGRDQRAGETLRRRPRSPRAAAPSRRSFSPGTACSIGTTRRRAARLTTPRRSSSDQQKFCGYQCRARRSACAVGLCARRLLRVPLPSSGSGSPTKRTETNQGKLLQMGVGARLYTMAEFALQSLLLALIGVDATSWSVRADRFRAAPARRATTMRSAGVKTGVVQDRRPGALRSRAAVRLFA